MLREVSGYLKVCGKGSLKDGCKGSIKVVALNVVLGHC